MQRGLSNNGGGSILSRILGRGQQMPQQSINPFQFGPATRNAAPTSPLSFLDPSRISNFLGQTQRVLGIAQQVGPMIQQYGPIIKNLPALWKIYKGFSNSDENKDQSTTDGESEQLNIDIDEYLNGDTNDFNEKENKEEKKEETRAKASEENIKGYEEKNNVKNSNKENQDNRNEKDNRDDRDDTNNKDNGSSQSKTKKNYQTKKKNTSKKKMMYVEKKSVPKIYI